MNFELFVEKYFGLDAEETTENTKIDCDFGQAVNLIAMYEEQRSPSVCPKCGSLMTKFFGDNGASASVCNLNTCDNYKDRVIGAIGMQTMSTHNPMEMCQCTAPHAKKQQIGTSVIRCTCGGIISIN